MSADELAALREQLAAAQQRIASLTDGGGLFLLAGEEVTIRERDREDDVRRDRRARVKYTTIDGAQVLAVFPDRGEPRDPSANAQQSYDIWRLRECADVLAEVWVGSPATRAQLAEWGYDGLIRCLNVLAQINVSARVPT